MVLHRLYIAWTLIITATCYVHPLETENESQRTPGRICDTTSLHKSVTSCKWNGTISVQRRVPHGAICLLASHRCYQCHNGQFVAAHCRYGRILKRRKRIWGSLTEGFKKFEKDFHRTISRPTAEFFQNLGNTPPRITCPDSGEVYTARQGDTTARVVWGTVRAWDRGGGHSIYRVSSEERGSYFPEGLHRIVYKAIDRGGLTDTCTFTFRVKVIRCDKPSAPRNGRVSCYGSVYGSNCYFYCHTGYTRRGTYSSKCQRYGYFSPSSPDCDRVSCGYLSTASHANANDCTDGDYYESQCHPVCPRGYRSAQGASAVCRSSGNWDRDAWKCEDYEAPRFTNCYPLLETYNTHYSWPELKSKDNSGHVNIKQVKGPTNGTELKFGRHVIEYLATDSAGNSDKCRFVLDVKKPDCAPPSVQDKDMKFTCNALSVGSVCQLSCRSGSYIPKGYSRYISCVLSTNSTSIWQPLPGNKQPKCFRKTCPDLRPPKNGALVCDKQLGGTICQLHCNKRFDVGPGMVKEVTYICGINSSNWLPSNVVPDCSQPEYPDKYFLPTEFYYFIGDCLNDDAILTMKENFMYNLGQMDVSPCYQDSCSIHDIDVKCGESEPEPLDYFDYEDYKRKRRAAVSRLHVSVTFCFENRNRNISPKVARIQLQEYVTQTLSVLESIDILKYLHSELSTPTPTTSELSVTGYRNASRLDIMTERSLQDRYNVVLTQGTSPKPTENLRDSLRGSPAETSDGSKPYLNEDRSSVTEGSPPIETEGSTETLVLATSGHTKEGTPTVTVNFATSGQTKETTPTKPLVLASTRVAEERTLTETMVLESYGITESTTPTETVVLGPSVVTERSTETETVVLEPSATATMFLAQSGVNEKAIATETAVLAPSRVTERSTVTETVVLEPSGVTEDSTAAESVVLEPSGVTEASTTITTGVTGVRIPTENMVLTTSGLTEGSTATETVVLTTSGVTEGSTATETVVLETTGVTEGSTATETVGLTTTGVTEGSSTTETVVLTTTGVTEGSTATETVVLKTTGATEGSTATETVVLKTTGVTEGSTANETVVLKTTGVTEISTATETVVLKTTGVTEGSTATETVVLTTTGVTEGSTATESVALETTGVTEGSTATESVVLKTTGVTEGSTATETVVLKTTGVTEGSTATESVVFKTTGVTEGSTATETVALKTTGVTEGSTANETVVLETTGVTEGSTATETVVLKTTGVTEGSTATETVVLTTTRVTEGGTPTESLVLETKMTSPPPILRVQAVTGSLTMSCAAGEVWLSQEDGVCVPCPAGTYSKMWATKCTPCPFDWYQNETGAESCKPCEPQHVTTSRGETSCSAQCKVGTFSVSGVEPCFPCPPQTFQDDIGGTTCYRCLEAGSRGEGLPECDNLDNQNTSTFSTAELQVSEFLLKCESVKCLSFEETADGE